jgi:hypothetical protein
VGAMAQIVHEADLCDQKFGRKEGFGIDEVLKGWARLGLSDREILQRGLQLVEGLYQPLSESGLGIGNEVFGNATVETLIK